MTVVFEMVQNGDLALSGNMALLKRATDRCCVVVTPYLGPLRGLLEMEVLLLLLPIAILLLLAKPRFFSLETFHFLPLCLCIVSPFSHLLGFIATKNQNRKKHCVQAGSHTCGAPRRGYRYSLCTFFAVMLNFYTIVARKPASQSMPL